MHAVLSHVTAERVHACPSCCGYMQLALFTHSRAPRALLTERALCMHDDPGGKNWARAKKGICINGRKRVYTPPTAVGGRGFVRLCVLKGAKSLFERTQTNMRCAKNDRQEGKGIWGITRCMHATRVERGRGAAKGVRERARRQRGGGVLTGGRRARLAKFAPGAAKAACTSDQIRCCSPRPRAAP
jgi:hypothetical protein